MKPKLERFWRKFEEERKEKEEERSDRPKDEARDDEEKESKESKGNTENEKREESKEAGKSEKGDDGESPYRTETEKESEEEEREREEGEKEERSETVENEGSTSTEGKEEQESEKGEVKGEEEGISAEEEKEEEREGEEREEQEEGEEKEQGEEEEQGEGEVQEEQEEEGEERGEDEYEEDDPPEDYREDREEEERKYGGYRNRREFYEAIGTTDSALRRELARLIDLLAEDLSLEKDYDYPERYDEEMLVRRVLDRSIPFSRLRTGKKRERIVVLIDTSGSCMPYAELLSSVGKVLSEYDTVELYTAPNGLPEMRYDRRKKDWELAPEAFDDERYRWAFEGRVIFFFGDFDGGDFVIEASYRNGVVWFSTEERYQDTLEHSWNSRPLSDFRGVYLPATSKGELLLSVRKLLREAQGLRSSSINSRSWGSNLRR